VCAGLGHGSACFCTDSGSPESANSGQYHHLFQADDLDLAVLAGSDSLLRILDEDNATQKGECEHLVSAQAADPRCTAVISIVPEYRGQDGSKKRRRTLSESTAHFPTQNQQGKKSIKALAVILVFCLPPTLSSASRAASTHCSAMMESGHQRGR